MAASVALYFLACWSVIAILWPPAVGGVWLVAGMAIATTAPIIAFATRRGWRHYPTGAFRLFVVRPVLYAQLLLPLVAAAGLLGMLAGAPFHASMNTGRVSAALVLSAMLLLFVIGYFGSSRLVVQPVVASVPDLPPSWDGLRIAQLSDLHVGPHTSRRFLARVAAQVEQLAPDLIAITGDMVDDRAEDVREFAEAFAGLTAPLGVYLIPGNHDVYAGWADVAGRLRTALPRVTILVNDSRTLIRDGAGLTIVGTGDPAGRHGMGDAAPDIHRALSQVPPGTPVIALAHNPALWPELAARGVALTLSGHTHWGQFAIPSWGWSLAGLFLPHAMGSYSETSATHGSLLYVSPGTGYWGLPFRIGANPEITLVTVSRGPAAITALRNGRT